MCAMSSYGLTWDMFGQCWTLNISRSMNEKRIIPQTKTHRLAADNAINNAYFQNILIDLMKCALNGIKCKHLETNYKLHSLFLFEIG